MTAPDLWTRWKLGERPEELAKEYGCTRERMRLRLKKLDEGRSVIELQRTVDELLEALEAAADALMDYSPLTGRSVETSASLAARALIAKHRKGG